MNKGEEKRKITNIDNTRVIQERIVTGKGMGEFYTKRIPLNGIININPINDNIISNKDLVKIINAYVSAEIEEEEIEEPIRNKMINYRFYNRVRYPYEEQKNNNINIFEISSKPMKSYRKLNVNMIIKIEVKTVRIEEIPINI